MIIIQITIKEIDAEIITEIEIEIITEELDLDHFLEIDQDQGVDQEIDHE